MAITPNYDLDVDTSLGGADASDYVIPSQKAIKAYVDNNSGYPSNYVTTDTDQNITGVKTYVGQKRIGFKQSATADKLGFTCFDASSNEIGAFEYRPNTISGGALFNINVPYTSTSYVGFRYWGTAVNIVAPKVATAGTYYILTHITDGTNTVTANNKGTVDISSLLPTVPTKTSDLTNDSGFITGITSSMVTTALGYTPYSNANPDGYITSAALSAYVKLDGGSTSQTIQLSSGTGTTPLTLKSKSSSSCYVSYNANGTWVGSLGVSSSKRPTFYNGTTYTLAYTSEIPDISGKVDKTSIVSTVSSSSTNSQVVGAKLFYDTVGNIESALNTINSGSST